MNLDRPFTLDKILTAHRNELARREARRGRGVLGPGDAGYSHNLMRINFLKSEIAILEESTNGR